MDAAERPDLLKRIRGGTLHELTCPHCGDAGHMDAPILIFRPDAEPPLLFSPAEQTSAEEGQDQAQQLVELLQSALGEEWQDDWLASGLPGVRREHLPAVVTGAAQVDSQLEAPLALLTGAGDLEQHLLELLEAGSLENGRSVVEQHPDLLSDEADELIQRLLAVEERPQARQFVEAWRGLLAWCREVGTAQAFEEAGLAEGGMDVPPQFRNDLQQAQEAKERYRRTGDRRSLDAAAAAWEHILRHPAFPATDERFQLAALNDAGGVFLRRYWAAGRLPDLNRALELWQQAVQRTPPDAPDLPGFLNNLGTGLRARFARTGDLADLAEAIRCWQRALERLHRVVRTGEQASALVGQAAAITRRLLAAHLQAGDPAAALAAAENGRGVRLRLDLARTGRLPAGLTPGEQQEYQHLAAEASALPSQRRGLAQAGLTPAEHAGQLARLAQRQAEVNARLDELEARDPAFLLRPLDYPALAALARRHGLTLVYVQPSDEVDLGAAAFIVHPASPPDAPAAEDVLRLAGLGRDDLHTLLFGLPPDVAWAPDLAGQGLPADQTGWRRPCASIWPTPRRSSTSTTCRPLAASVCG